MAQRGNRGITILFLAAGRMSDRLAGTASNGLNPCQPVLTTYMQPRHIPRRGYNITQSSAPDDGHMVARNMLSN